MRDSASLVAGNTTLADDERPPEAAAVIRGTAVDRYVVLERLGAGAMGVVYAAFDPRLDRQVAVKLLNRRADQDPERLLDEARALAKLSHPNVVSVHDAGLYDDTVFITMERVDGSTLDAWLRPQRTWREVLGVLLGAGRGLVAAHLAGTVHGDFKPKNVMVASNGITKVMDFGLAAFVGTEPEVEEGRRRPQGTPMYMAPELHLGQPPTAVSDQYAFCVVAYEALAGRHPRAGIESMGGLLDALGREPPPLACPGLPKPVRAAIIRGLCAEPGARWPSMKALLEVFAAALRGSRSRWLGLATLTGLGGIAWAVSGSDEPSRCPDAAEVARAMIPEAERAEVEAALASFDASFGTERAAMISEGIDHYARRWAEADAAACRATAQGQRDGPAVSSCLRQREDDFQGALAVLQDAVGVERVRAADLLDALPDPRGCLEGEGAASFEVEPPPVAIAERVAALRGHLATLRAQTAVGRWVEVVEEVGPVLEEARALGYTPLLAEALWVRGAAHVELRSTSEAERDLSDAAWMALEEGDHRLALRAALGLVELQRETSESHRNLAWAQRASRLIRGGSAPSVEAEIELHLSSSQRHVGAFEDAKAHAEAALEVIRRVHGEEHPEYAEATHAYAAAAFRLGEYAHALQIAQENIERRERVLGQRHPALVASLQLFAAVAMANDRLDEAEAAILRAIDLQRTVVGPRTGVQAGLLNNLGALYQSQGRYDEAHAALDEAIEIWEAHELQDMLVYAYASMGKLAVEDGDDAAAGRWFTRAWETLDALGGPHPLRGIVAAQAGAASLRRTDLEAARTWLVRADEQGSLRGEELRAHQGWWALLYAREGDAAEAARLAGLAGDGPSPLGAGLQSWWAEVEALRE